MRILLLSVFLMTQTLFAQTITIAVAANVSYAIEELKEAFSKLEPDTQISVILGSSGKLAAQIKNGAPYGLFMSANMKYPQALFDEGFAISKPRVYAQGALAYFSVKKQDFSQGINLLRKEDIQRIAIANPKTAPYGKAALEAISSAKVYDEVSHKLIYAESISQTVSYAVTAADIGLIAKSSLYSSKMAQYREGVHWQSVEADLYTPIEQGVVLLKKAGEESAYRAFYDFILSEQAKKIFRKYGYIIE